MADWPEGIRTRESGAALRNQVEDALAKGETVVMDFAGIDWVRMGFLDELFGVWILKPPEELAEKMEVEGMSARLVSVRAEVERVRREWWDREREGGKEVE